MSTLRHLVALRWLGYSLTFWTILFGFIMIPILALSIELGRYFYARAEITKAAAALVTAEEISQGWRPLGGIAVTHEPEFGKMWYCQAMIKGIGI
jgi:hypothetical protein